MLSWCMHNDTVFSFTSSCNKITSFLKIYIFPARFFPNLSREFPPTTVIISLFATIKFSSISLLETVPPTTSITAWSNVIRRTVSIFFFFFFIMYSRILLCLPSYISLRNCIYFTYFSHKFNMFLIKKT